MGYRTPEAIARRAAKRGRSVEEQKHAERKDERKKAAAIAAAADAAPSTDTVVTSTVPKDEHRIEGTTRAEGVAEASGKLAVGVPVFKLPGDQRAKLFEEGKLKKDAKKGWMCMGLKGQHCGEVNFAYRQTCRKCGAKVILPPTTTKPKPAAAADGTKVARAVKPNPGLPATFVEKAAAAAAAAGETNDKCFKCGQTGHWARHCTAAPVHASSRLAKGMKPPSDPTRAWEGTNAAGAAEANAALRKRYTADPDALSEADRARAAALIARDARKAEKRAMLKDSKAAVAKVAKAFQAGGKAGMVLSTSRGPAPESR